MIVCPPRITHHESRTTRRGGFSLIEVLMSLAIFLLSLVALSQLIDIGGDRARDTQWLSQATTIAQSNLNKLIAGILPLISQPDGPSDEDPDWTYSIDAEADNTPGLFLVTVVVSRPRNDGSRFETKLVQYVLDPLQRGSTTGTDADTTATTGSGTTGGGGGG